MLLGLCLGGSTVLAGLGGICTAPTAFAADTVDKTYDDTSWHGTWDVTSADTLTLKNSSTGFSMVNSEASFGTVNVIGGQFYANQGSVGTLNVEEETGYTSGVTLEGTTSVGNLNLANSATTVNLADTAQITGTALISAGTLNAGYEKHDWNAGTTSDQSYSGTVNVLDLEGSSNLVLYKSDLLTNTLIYNTTGTVTNEDNHTVTTNALTLGSSMTSDQLSNMKKLNLVAQSSTGLAITNNSTLDDATAAALISSGTVSVVDADGTTNWYSVSNNAASVIDKSTIAEVTLNKYKNTFETAYGAACTDPFHNALDDSAVSNTLASLNDAAGKLVASEASSYTEGRLQSARRLGVTPTLASQQSMNVVNNIVNGNAASRMASLRTQAESESNVKGATDFGSSDFWTTVKRSRTTVKNGQYADADVSVTNYQIGYDFRNAENSYLGVYLGMTAGNVKSNGYTTDIDQAYDFGIYGTRALHRGQYLNYLARFGVMSNKMEDSTWDTSDMGLSFEYGKKMQYGKDLFFTPYVRLDYDRVRTDAVTYASGNQVAADTANNVTGKLGFTLEKTFAAGNSLYFGSAYSHGLSGSSTTYFNQTALPAVDNDAKVVYVNIGTKQMLGDASYLDINYEKTFLDYDGWSLQAKYNLMF